MKAEQAMTPSVSGGEPGMSPTVAPGAPAEPASGPAERENAAGPLDRWVLPVVWAFSALYLLHYALRGWISHDEGTIGQSAERLLRGELPHRDFVEVYTGGLTYLHALAFRVLGINMVSPRVVLFLFALAWVPAAYWIARKFSRPLVAGGITLVALFWGLPNYFAALPSWYNMIFATFAGAALLRFSEKRSRAWMALAGLAAGASVLAKLTGIFLIAAGLLFLLYMEREDLPADQPEQGRSARVYPILVSAGCAAFLILLLASLRQMLAPSVVYHFFFPVAAVTSWIIWLQWASPVGGPIYRFRRLWDLLWPFVLGIAVPLLVFLVPFLLAGAVGNLLRGVFVLPFRRLGAAAAAPPSVWISIAAVLPIALLLALPALRRVRWPFAAAFVVVLLALAPSEPMVYRIIFLVAQASVPVVVAAGVLLLALRRHDGLASAPARQRVTLLLLLTALCGLVRFPFAVTIYFCYIAPIEVLAFASVFSLVRRPPRVALWALGALGGAFAMLLLNTGFIHVLGLAYLKSDQTAELALPRGGVRVSPRDSAVYLRVSTLVSAHARGPYIYAGPDAPEVYFLTGTRNPTPNLFEFFDEPVGREARLLAAIDAHHVSVIVLNMSPDFSPPPSAALLAQLSRRFPRAIGTGRFVVAWHP